MLDSSSLPLSLGALEPGLCFYLFLVGLELDPAVLRRNAGRAIGTSVAGMVIPFALGAASSWGLYKQFMDVPGAAKVPPFGSFLLFLGGGFERMVVWMIGVDKLGSCFILVAWAWTRFGTGFLARALA